MTIYGAPQDLPPPKPPAEEAPQQRILRLLKSMFQLFTTHLGLDTEQMVKVKLKDFVGYSLENTCEWYDGNGRAEMLKLNVREDAIEAVYRCFQDPYDAVALMLPFWHSLCLSGRPPLKNVPNFMDVCMTCGWVENGKQKAFQIRVPTKFDPAKGLTDGFLCSLLKDQCDGIVQTIAGNGLDALYDKHALDVGESGDFMPKRPLTPEEKTRGNLGL